LLSPILIRPIREQIEHDRIIRVLQARLRKQYDVEANIGDERRVPVRVGLQTLYPDLVLTAMGAPRKLQGIIEVETIESVNYLEAMAEWAHYAKAKAPFHLYVPQTLVDMARRLLETHQIEVDQLWSYAALGDQVHFWLVSSDGDGGVVTSVTDSILIAEPSVAPPPAEPASSEARPERAVESPTPEVARPAPKVVKPAAGEGRKPVAAAAKAQKPARPVKVTPAPRPAGRPAAARAKKAGAVGKAGSRKATRPVATKGAAAKVRKATRPAAKPVGKAAAWSRPRPAAKGKGRRPKAKRR
jgi:hypothetical protein